MCPLQVKIIFKFMENLKLIYNELVNARNQQQKDSANQKAIQAAIFAQ